MGRKVCVELDENGESSYFRSMEEAARALNVNPREIKAAIKSGTPVRGTKTYVRPRPWKRLQKDRRFFTICYAIPWNYRCGLDKIAEEMGLTMTGLIRHCVTTTFTEEYIWTKAQESEGFVPEKFQPLPQGKPRVWLIDNKRRKRSKSKVFLENVSTKNYGPHPKDQWWLRSPAERDKYLTAREKKRLSRLDRITKLMDYRIKLVKEKLGELGYEISLRRGVRRPSTQYESDRLLGDTGRDSGRPGRKKNVQLCATSRRNIRAIRRRHSRVAGKGRHSGGSEDAQ